MLFRKNRISYLMLILCLMLLASIQPINVHAEEKTAPDVSHAEALSIHQTADNVLIEWQMAPNDDAVSASSALNSLSTLRYGGYDLPVQLLRFEADGSANTPHLTIEQIDATAWTNEPIPARELIPPVVDWTPSEGLENGTEESFLPSQPVFIHSTGRLRGHEIHVVAISPIFEEDGVIKVAQNIEARMSGVVEFEGSLAELILTKSLQAGDVQASAVNGPVFADAVDLAPTNSAAAVNSVKLIVSEGGIQSVSGAQLKETGLNLSDVSKLSLTFNGQPIPLEIRGTNANGSLDADETIRFYAPGIGDYWNAEEIYWLSDNGSNPFRLELRDTTPGSAPQRTTAFQNGVWRDNKVYEPEWAGHDEDHWFAKRMTVSPDMQGLPDEYPHLTAIPARTLPQAAGESTITPNLMLIQQVAEYELDVIAGNTTKTAKLKPQDAVVMDGYWAPELKFPNAFSSIELILIPTDSRGTLLVDNIEWTAPVDLSFDGKGAVFSGDTGTWRYKTSGLAAGANIYDITDPLLPVRLEGLSNGTFEDGPTARKYLVTGEDTLHIPEIEIHVPVVFSASNGAHALYIAPQGFVADLAPLVAHRQGQGYQVKIVNIQDIYDAWSYGHMSPAAVRDFLRFAVQQWSPSPISAVLVSDGTRDPFNYENKASNVNFIPPYLIPSFVDKNGIEKPLDPFWGQNGCENCFGQLDGDDPLNNDVETPGTGFMPDIWIGRFPAKSTADVKSIVSKIISYETSDVESNKWRSQALFLADNYYYADGTIDKAGDFVKFSEEAINLLPRGVRAERLYYDPTAPADDPWRESNSVAMRDQAIDLMGDGYGLVTYNGHSAHWQWARTSDCAIPLEIGEVCPPDQKNSDPYIFGLYDNDRLLNIDQLHVGLSMTCFTSQFFEPANSGTVLDERAVTHPAGAAVAVWGPAGLSVATGHDDLQYGFHNLLWELTRAKPGSARLGQLIEAGYVENMAPSCEERNPDNPVECYSCCDDVRRTFLLLGDPLTPVQMTPNNDVYLPQISR